MGKLQLLVSVLLLTIGANIKLLDAVSTINSATFLTGQRVNYFGMFLTISSLQLSVISLILIHSDTPVIIQSIIVTLQNVGLITKTSNTFILPYILYH